MVQSLFPMKIIVLIVTYNGQQWLDKCLSSLTRSILPLDVVVVDNASSDKTLEILGDYKISKLFALDENLGFGKANNLGIKYALEQSADYVFLLNQDAWIRPDTIELLVKASQRNPEYYILSPLHMEGTETKLDLNFQHYISPPNCKDLLFDLEHNKENLRDVYETTFVNAALWLLPRACLTQIGGFDPIFQHYGEDNDLAKRVRYHGYKVGVCPKAVGVHDREQRADFALDAYKRKTLKKRKTDALIKLKDINVPLNSVLQTVYYKSLKSSIKNLLKLNLPELSNELKLFSYTRRNLKAVREHRRISEQLEAPLQWLPNIPK
jgi:GT2 family glycosyltransferase